MFRILSKWNDLGSFCSAATTTDSLKKGGNVRWGSHKTDDINVANVDSNFQR